jgi:hypothetical protein
MISFVDRAEEMGLDISKAYKGHFSYQDQYSEVVYRQLVCQDDPHGEESNEYMDGEATPVIGIFTRGSEEEDFKYVGYVSSLYKFIGNDVLNQKIRDAINEVGMPIVNEYPSIAFDYTRMRNEIIIQNGQNVAQVGDVLPTMIVNNSYNGTKAATISYGLAFSQGHQNLSFAFKLGELRQVHVVSAATSLSSSVNSYMQFFTENITEIISRSFSAELTETEMLATLDVIEGIGKKKRDDISKLLSDIQQESGSANPTAWQMFLAIVRYSSLEPNLNIKRMLENAAESVLVIPGRMMDVLAKINE